MAFMQQLQTVISQSFSIEEIKSLFFHLDLSDEHIQGNRDVFARELIKTCQQRNLIPQLLQICQQQRPNVQFPQSPKQRLIENKQGLIKRMREIMPIFNQVLAWLKQLEDMNLDADNENNLLVLETFLQGDLPADDFMLYWQQQQQQTPKQSIDYTALAHRLKHGDVSLCLGLDLPTELTQQLAAQFNYADFNGSFSQLCEYAEQNTQYGRSFLRDATQQGLSNAAEDNPLIHLLAQLDTPLLTICTGYDVRLEQAFDKYRKPYVIISHAHHRQDLGAIYLKYSDQNDTQTSDADKLYGLPLLDEGYSIIYKPRGCFLFKPNLNDCLLLSEPDYLGFIRYLDKIIPDYLAEQLTQRALWFLNQPLQHWEDRLLVTALLEKRKTDQQAMAFDNINDKFTTQYWENKVRVYQQVDIKDFSEQLGQQL